MPSLVKLPRLHLHKNGWLLLLKYYRLINMHILNSFSFIQYSRNTIALHVFFFYHTHPLPHLMRNMICACIFLFLFVYSFVFIYVFFIGYEEMKGKGNVLILCVHFRPQNKEQMIFSLKFLSL